MALRNEATQLLAAGCQNQSRHFMTQHSLFNEQGTVTPWVACGPDVTASDAQRMGRQLKAVRELMSDGEWRTIEIIQGELRKQDIAASAQGISARLRDLRKQPWKLTVERERIAGGLWKYRVL